MSPEPLLIAIHGYLDSLKEFERLATLNPNCSWDDIAARTYEPALDTLAAWEDPATTLEGAKEALRISMNDTDGCYGHPAAEVMAKAALAYLEGACR